ncbi:hypothetical protein FRC07_003262 [Ceratobasidium sp. 392]|nr:hypothetical protein FRC07_003262 [Ceratobasidium sp. 392]
MPWRLPRFRRDAEDGDGARELLSSGRPTFKNALSFSQASGSAMGSMGSFRHPSSRLDADARREEREREREREGRRDTENLRNLSVQFDRERRDREAAPHLPRVVSGASATNGRDPKARELGRDSREGTKEPARESRRGRGDDTNDWRRARDDDGRQRSRSRARDRPGRGDREPANGQKRERDGWTAAEDRRGASGASGRRRGAEDRLDGKSKEDRAPPKNERDKLSKEEQEPAWMGDYVPETGGKSILGSGGAEDSIQAWKRELKEKERGAQGGDMDALEEEGLGGLEDEITHMKLVEERVKQDGPDIPVEDDGLDEIQRFKKMMQESDRKRREEAERNARELAGKSDVLSEAEQASNTMTPATHPVPPGLTKPSTEPYSAPTPPPAPESSAPTNGRIGGVSILSPSWPVSSTVTPSATTATLSSPGWTQSSGSLPDTSPTNPRLSPIQNRRFPQDGSVSQMGSQDGSQVGTRSTSRFANFFGDKQREPTGATPRFNDNPAPNAPHSSFLQGSNEPQLLDSLLARLAESQMRPQTQTVPQGQDRTFSQRAQGTTPQQGQYGNALPQSAMNMHAAPPLIQHQRQQLSLQQQQQQLLSSLNASAMLPGNPSNLQGMNHGGLSSHIVGNRTPSGGYRNGPSPIGGHNPNPMQRAPDLPQYLGGMSGPLGGGIGGGAGSSNGPQQQYSNRLGGMGNLGGMLGAGGPVNQPRFDERQRIQQSQNAPMHHQSGQSLSGIGGLPLDFNLLQQQQQPQPSQRQMPRNAGGYGIQQNQASMGPRSASGLHGLGAQQYPGHMHNDFVVQPSQSPNDLLAMFMANQGNNMGA